MGRLSNARHKLGFHTGDWVFDAPDSCAQTRHCTGCSDISTRVRHDLTGWAYREPRAANACVKDRTCMRCSLSEAEQEHSFKWVYSDELPPESGLLGAFSSALKSTCHQIMVCEYCREPGKGTRVEHTWGEMVRNENDGNYYRGCVRCDVVDKTRMPFG
jgi:hypothetical protein